MTSSGPAAEGHGSPREARENHDCPVCDAAGRAEHRMLDEAFEQVVAGRVPSVAGEGLRGACRKHGARTSWEEDALDGLTRMYLSVLGSLLRELQNNSRRSFLGFWLGEPSPVPRRIRPVCRICRARHDAEWLAIKELVAALTVAS